MHYFYNTLYGIFIGLLVLVGGFFLLSFTTFDTGVEAKIVQSGSMAPSIPVGALVFIAPSEAYAVGDVVTFGEEAGGAIPTTHRIVSVGREGGAVVYETKGDANEEADPFMVAKSEVIGKVHLTVPYAGFVFDFARQPFGFALLIGVPALLVVVSEIIAIAYELRAARPARPARASARRAGFGLRLGPTLRRAWTIFRARRRRARTVAQPLVLRASAGHALYERRFPTDDIFLPVRARRIPVTHYASAFSSFVSVLCITSLVSLQGVGGTLSFFRDTETSTGNTFTASESFPNGAETTGGGGPTPTLSAQASELPAEEGKEPLVAEAAEEETVENEEGEISDEAIVEEPEQDAEADRENDGQRVRGERGEEVERDERGEQEDERDAVRAPRAEKAAEEEAVEEVVEEEIVEEAEETVEEMPAEPAGETEEIVEETPEPPTPEEPSPEPVEEAPAEEPPSEE